MNALVSKRAEFAQEVQEYLLDGGFAGLQLDFRHLNDYQVDANALTQALLTLSSELFVPLSAVIQGADASAMPLNLTAVGGAVSPHGVAPLQVVTTDTFTADVADMVRTLNATSDAFGSNHASAAAYAPGISISDEYVRVLFGSWLTISVLSAAVSYTHLTLPTIYSV